jgi:hypothetical protein
VRKFAPGLTCLLQLRFNAGYPGDGTGGRCYRVAHKQQPLCRCAGGKVNRCAKGL